MSCTGNRPRLFISHGPKKKIHPEPDPHIGNLTPDVQTDTLPSFTSPDLKKENVLKLGKYILFKQNEKLDSYQAIDTTGQEELTCKTSISEHQGQVLPLELEGYSDSLSPYWQVLPLEGYGDSLSPYWQVDDHQHVAATREIVLGQTRAYIFFPRSHGDLHSYVRHKKRLRENEASRLFSQIVSAIVHCHENGVILRDLKLRKFVFEDAERTNLLLEGLEDAVVLSEDQQDVLKDKHGCPAYVSPEILSASQQGYSGKAADVWSLGVMLYTMLVGRYPFHDSQPLALFGKIRRGYFHLPDALSPKAKCLIRCLLRRDPAERLAAGDILSHPWFQSVPCLRRLPNSQHSKLQVVPDMAAAAAVAPPSVVAPTSSSPSPPEASRHG